jgi:hypothetical protein
VWTNGGLLKKYSKKMQQKLFNNHRKHVILHMYAE